MCWILILKVWAGIFDNQIITGWLIAGTRLLKNLSGHTFRVKKNLQTSGFLTSNMYSRKFQITVEKNLHKALTCRLAQLWLSSSSFTWWKGKCTMLDNVQNKLPFVNSMKSLIFDSTKIPLPKRLVLTHRLIAKVMLGQILLAELKSSCQLLSYVQFIWVVIFQVELWLLIRAEKWFTLSKSYILS